MILSSLFEGHGTGRKNILNEMMNDGQSQLKQFDHRCRTLTNAKTPNFKGTLLLNLFVVLMSHVWGTINLSFFKKDFKNLANS